MFAAGYKFRILSLSLTPSIHSFFISCKSKTVAYFFSFLADPRRHLSHAVSRVCGLVGRWQYAYCSLVVQTCSWIQCHPGDPTIRETIPEMIERVRVDHECDHKAMMSLDGGRVVIFVGGFVLRVSKLIITLFFLRVSWILRAISRTWVVVCSGLTGFERHDYRPLFNGSALVEDICIQIPSEPQVVCVHTSDTD